MTNKEILDKIKSLSDSEKRAIPYVELVSIIKRLSKDEIIDLANIIGYHVFIRMCMGEIGHMVPIIQNGAAAIIVNEKKEILLQSRADRDKWGLPGGCQAITESLEDTVIREVKEETDLNVKKEDLKLIESVSGESRRNDYPNGDTVFNNTNLYYIDKYTGTLKWDDESKEMKFFSIDNLPENLMDKDLIDVYIEKMIKK